MFTGTDNRGAWVNGVLVTPSAAFNAHRAAYTEPTKYAVSKRETVGGRQFHEPAQVASNLTNAEIVALKAQGRTIKRLIDGALM
jgi:hypothetical protein